jgi:hypothetical protein
MCASPQIANPQISNDYYANRKSANFLGDPVSKLEFADLRNLFAGRPPLRKVLFLNNVHIQLLITR